MYITLSRIISGLTATNPDFPTAVPMFVCPILARIPGVQSASYEITPLLFAFVKELAPELIVKPANIAIMDRWLNYDAFQNSQIADVREIANKYLVFAVNGQGQNHIRDDNTFKVKFYTYLLERHGDVGFELP